MSYEYAEAALKLAAHKDMPGRLDICAVEAITAALKEAAAQALEEQAAYFEALTSKNISTFAVVYDLRCEVEALRLGGGK